MYDRPELSAAHNALWGEILTRVSAHAPNAPLQLDQSKEGLDAWLDPKMLLSQTCGRPLKKVLSQKVTLIGTPDYGLEDCPPGYYYSEIIAYADDPRVCLSEFDGSHLIVNSQMSQSGWAAIAHASDELGITFGTVSVSGAHANSVQAVAHGHAEVASIDAVSWRNLAHFEDITGVKVIGRTVPTPGLPFITNKAQKAEPWFNAVSEAIAALPITYRDSLGIQGLEPIPLDAYMDLYEPKRSLA